MKLFSRNELHFSTLVTFAVLLETNLHNVNLNEVSVSVSFFYFPNGLLKLFKAEFKRYTRITLR